MAKRFVEDADYFVAVERMLLSAGRRAGRADPEQLAQLIAIRDTLDEAIRMAVAGLRASGITWQSIAEATGTTKSAAIQKWRAGLPSPSSPVADDLLDGAGDAGDDEGDDEAEPDGQNETGGVEGSAEGSSGGQVDGVSGG